MGAVLPDFWGNLFLKQGGRKEKPLYNKGANVQQAGRSRGPFFLWARPGGVEPQVAKAVQQGDAAEDFKVKLASGLGRNICPTGQGRLARGNRWRESHSESQRKSENRPPRTLEPHSGCASPLKQTWGLGGLGEMAGH